MRTHPGEGHRIRARGAVLVSEIGALDRRLLSERHHEARGPGGGVLASQARIDVGIEAPRRHLDGGHMRYIGIDIGSKKHFVAVADGDRNLLVKARAFEESRQGYEKLKQVLGSPEDCVVAMEATGHYWQNVYVELARADFAVVLINPLRTRRYAEEDLAKAKTDKIDAQLIARFAAEKRVEGQKMRGELSDALREVISLRDRLQQDLDDRTRQLHRALDLSFPESKKLFKSLKSLRTTTILMKYPGGEALASAKVEDLAELGYDGRHVVGEALASALIETAKTTVGAHQGGPYSRQIKYYCEDIQTLLERLDSIDREVGELLDGHELPTLLMTIPGVGKLTTARVIATVGNPADFASGDAFASYVGAVPQVKHSGQRKPNRAAAGAMSNTKLRAKLWSPTIVGIRHNPLLGNFYERLCTRGKPKKVAIIACMRKLLQVIYSVAKNRKAFEVRPVLAEGAQ